MNLFEIDARISQLFDEETGEIFDIEALEALEMAEKEKLTNIIRYYKNLEAEAASLKKAAKDLTDRAKAKESKMASLLSYIDSHQKGNAFECTEGVLKYTKSTTTDQVDEMAFLTWEGRFGYGESTFTPSKKAIGDAIKAGIKIPGWVRTEHQNPSIK